MARVQAAGYYAKPVLRERIHLIVGSSRGVAAYLNRQFEALPGAHTVGEGYLRDVIRGARKAAPWLALALVRVAEQDPTMTLEDASHLMYSWFSFDKPSEEVQ